MKKARVILSAILIVAMSATMLISCSNKNGGEGEGPKTDKLTIMTSNRVLSDKNDTKTWMEEELGVKLDFITVTSGAEYITKVNLLISSGEIPDIVTDSKYVEYYKHMQDGLYIDIEPYLEKYGQNILKVRSKENLDSLRWKDGKLYCISNNVNSNYDALLIRMDWLDKLGLKVPETLDEFVNVARAFKENDMNGNGKADEIGMGGWNPSIPIKPFNHIFAAFGSSPYGWVLKDGKIVRGELLPETKEAVKFLNTMYKEGLIDPEYLTVDRTKLNEKVGTEKVGLVLDQVWYTNKDNSIYHPNKEVEWAAIKPPVGKNGQSGITLVADPNASGRTGITIGSKDPVTAMKYLNFIADVDNFNRIRAGIEGTHYNLVNGECEVTEKYRADNSLLLQEGIAPTYATPFMPQDPPALVIPKYVADFKELLNSTQKNSLALYGSVPEIEERQIGAGWEDYLSEAINRMIIEGGDIDAQFDKMVDDMYSKYNMAEQEKLAQQYYEEYIK